MNNIQEKVREMRLRWYGHMQRMEENDEMRAVVDKVVPGKDQGGDQEGDGLHPKGQEETADHSG